jgi:hypothetical protein
VVFKEEILKVSNKHAPVPFTLYVKKDTLFTEDSSDDDFNNERKGDDISLLSLMMNMKMMILERSLRMAPTS